MNNLNLIFFVIMTISFAAAKAQSSEALIGTWKSTYNIDGEVVHVGYAFKMENGKLQCHTLSIKDKNGNEEVYTSLAMTAITFKDGKGKSQYMLEYDGETYEVMASLNMVDANTLEVSYSDSGYADTEIWKRVQ